MSATVWTAKERQPGRLHLGKVAYVKIQYKEDDERTNEVEIIKFVLREHVLTQLEVEIFDRPIFASWKFDLGSADKCLF